MAHERGAAIERCASSTRGRASTASALPNCAIRGADEATAESWAILERLQTHRAHMPALWLWETANVLVQAERWGRISPAAIRTYLGRLEEPCCRPWLGTGLMPSSRRSVLLTRKGFDVGGIHQAAALAILAQSGAGGRDRQPSRLLGIQSFLQLLLLQPLLLPASQRFGQAAEARQVVDIP